MKTAVALVLVAVSITTLNNFVFHPQNSSVWYVIPHLPSEQPCVFSKMGYMSIKGVRLWVTSTGRVNVTLVEFDPYALNDPNEVGIEFYVIPSVPCYVTFNISGCIPVAKYLVTFEDANGKETITVNSTYNQLKFEHYFKQPTYVKLETVQVISKVTPPPIKTKKGVGFEGVFAVMGLITTAYLLRKRGEGR